MATLTRYPTSNAVGTTGWTNPGNAYADDGVYATCAPAKSATISSYFSGFDFSSIGDSDTINSVTLYCEYHVDTQASIGDIALRTYDNTTQIGTTDLTNNTEPLTDTAYSQVIAPTLAQLKSSTFRIRVSGHRGSSNTAVTLSLDYVKVVVDYTPAATGYTLTADAGSFSLAGQTAILKADRKLVCGSGNFALTGIDANLTKGAAVNHYTLACGAGNFTLSGQPANLKANRKLTSGTGTFNVAGQPIGLKASRKLSANVGAFTLSGQGASLKVSRRLSALAGIFTLTGIAVNLNKSNTLNHYTLSCGSGSFALNGQAARLKADRRMVASKGAFILTGMDALMSKCEKCKRRGSMGVFGINGGLGQLRIQ
jgi:hypothetical protein